MTQERYVHAKVYKIWNDQTDDIYVGSTCKMYLSQRMSNHRKATKDTTKQQIKLYRFMNQIGFGHFHIELLENVQNCTDINHLRAREGYWIKLLNCSLNQRIECRTQREYYEQHKDEYKAWRESNKEYIKTYKHEMYENNKSDILEKQKLYYERNNDKINEYDRKRYANNPQRKLAQLVKKTCDCGATVSSTNMAAHKRAIKHKLYEMFGGLNNINIE